MSPILRKVGGGTCPPVHPMIDAHGQGRQFEDDCSTLPARHDKNHVAVGHSGDKSHHAITCTGTDNTNQQQISKQVNLYRAQCKRENPLNLRCKGYSGD